ncbi:uncharacterized protein LOC110808410 [Carica papaya]|uniref:uncharacterized protein LOC110808410 n=1 Tax=Carica papaya TaxID=3649 RepID=UPI000B8C9F4D|nr:uncharacterized protein LOC110808410 [Carica papaya]
MIKTLSPYSTTAKTAEIMSRYRPIAPKPEVPMDPISDGAGSSMSQKIRQSPYLRNLWPQLQARPTRTRKRGRAPLSPPSLKRARTHHVLGLSVPSHVTSPAKALSSQAFTHLPAPNLAPVTCNLENPATQSPSLVTLPLLPCSPSVPVILNQATTGQPSCMETIDLNKVAEIPEEKDLLQQLQTPPTTISNVMKPQPIRPVGSRISVGCINEDPNLFSTVQIPRKAEEVEDEMESEALPAVISDSNNKVRLANSAYRKMVGQPECSWLEAMVTSGERGSSSCKRICGEVGLHFCDSRVPVSSNGFSCWVRIDWGSDGKNNSIHAFCDVVRLSCLSKDYLFTWRFHTREAARFRSNV